MLSTNTTDSPKKHPDFREILLSRHDEHDWICVSAYKVANGKFIVSERFCNGVDEAANLIERSYQREDIGAIWTNIQRLKPGSSRRRKGETIDAYTNIVIDIDRKIKKDADGNKVNATDEERVVLREAAEEVHKLLAKYFGTAVFADSGNGYHLSWRCEPMEPKEGQDLYRQLLAALCAQFERDGLNMEIDLSLADDTQVVTVWGTWNRKNPDMLDRPQRQSKALLLPPQKPITRTDILLAIVENEAPAAAHKPTTKKSAKTDKLKGNPEWLEEHGAPDLIDFWSGHIAYESDSYDKDGDTHHPIAPCPCHEGEDLHEHSHAKDCEIIEFADGGIGISCFSRDFGLRTVIAKMNKIVGKNYPHMVYAEEIAAAFSARPLKEPKEPEPKLKYPSLVFPREAVKAIPQGSIMEKLLVKMCEGGLSLGWAVPTLLAIVSAVPKNSKMEGARINLYVTLLAMVGAGKDTAIDRGLEAAGVLNTNYYSVYAPSGERSISTLVGDIAPEKGSNERIPGPDTQLIVTYELEESLNKAKGDSSSLLQALQHYYDHNTKQYADSKTRTKQNVDCRISWLTALPVGYAGEIDENMFRRAFGEGALHGIESRMIFGFSEKSFDRRATRNWHCEEGFHLVGDAATAGSEFEGDFLPRFMSPKLIDRWRDAEVQGFAPGVEQQYLDWEPKKDLSGRDTYYVLKVAILSAIVNLHSIIEQSDFDFAKAFMDWQHEIRTVFQSSRAVRITQGEFNEIILRETAKVVERLKSGGKIKRGMGRSVIKDGETLHFANWKQMSNQKKWHRYGLDTEKSIERLVANGDLAYKTEWVENDQGKNGSEKLDKAWVRLPSM